MMIFLKWANVEHEVQKGDWPPKPERDPEEYTDDKIITMLDAADDSHQNVNKLKIAASLLAHSSSRQVFMSRLFAYLLWPL